MKNRKRPGQLPVNVHEALDAIASTGKGRCWYCDSRLPDARTAIRRGWDVQRVDQEPVASIILVCPDCVNRPTRVVRVRPVARTRYGHGRLALEPRRV